MEKPRFMWLRNRVYKIEKPVFSNVLALCGCPCVFV